MKKILVIEDDPAILTGLEALLEEEHYEVSSSSDGLEGYEKARIEKFDLIILDLQLPGKNGMDVCKDLRKAGVNTPILMLTVKKEELDKVLGLELGADDYVTKPFSPRELLARIKALLRRNSAVRSEIEECSFGNIYINFKNQEAIKNKEPFELSNMEFKVIKYFVQYEGEVIERSKLLDDVWGYDNFPSTRTVDNFILALRKKIEEDPSDPKHILTVHKAGYK
ncbi:MAG: response regulator transcription factor, partial [Ignavibacteriaceae bacterium]|nr:response regulator transcription factor [Ignavibacteriaceae bacterium]